MQVSENELREAIRSALETNKSKNKNLVVEQYMINMQPSDLYTALIEPWINVLKIAKLEAQKTLNNVLHLFRVMITFNTGKLQNIRDRHRDRSRRLNQQTNQILDSMGGGAEGAAIAFMLNPGAFIAGKALGSGEVVAEIFLENLGLEIFYLPN